MYMYLCYYVIVMKETQTTEQTNFTIYRDGQLDKAWFYKTKARGALQYATKQTLRAISGALGALDELVVEFEKINA